MHVESTNTYRVLGMGLMGTITTRLLQVGYTVAVWNKSNMHVETYSTRCNSV